jgi:hypothetical protein
VLPQLIVTGIYRDLRSQTSNDRPQVKVKRKIGLNNLLRDVFNNVASAKKAADYAEPRELWRLTKLRRRDPRPGCQRQLVFSRAAELTGPAFRGRKASARGARRLIDLRIDQFL